MKLATGGKGKQFNDRELAAEVRTLTLNEIKVALGGEDIEFKKAVILRLCGSILPRINAFEGNPGDDIEVIIRQRNAKTTENS